MPLALLFLKLPVAIALLSFAPLVRRRCSRCCSTSSASIVYAREFGERLPWWVVARYAVHLPALPVAARLLARCARRVRHLARHGRVGEDRAQRRAPRGARPAAWRRGRPHEHRRSPVAASAPPPRSRPVVLDAPRPTNRDRRCSSSSGRCSLAGLDARRQHVRLPVPGGRRGDLLRRRPGPCFGEWRLAPYTYFYDHAPLGWVQLAPVAAGRRGSGTSARQHRWTRGVIFMLVLQLASSTALVFAHRATGSSGRHLWVAAARRVCSFALSTYGIHYHRRDPARQHRDVLDPRSASTLPRRAPRGLQAASG